MSTNRGRWSFIAVMILDPCRLFHGRAVPGGRTRDRPGDHRRCRAGLSGRKDASRPDVRASARGRRHGHRPGRSAAANVATVVLDAGGAAVVALPAGNYVVQPQRVTGLMGTAAATDVTVVDGTLTPVVLSYDTGIR